MMLINMIAAAPNNSADEQNVGQRRQRSSLKPRANTAASGQLTKQDTDDIAKTASISSNETVIARSFDCGGGGGGGDTIAPSTATCNEPTSSGIKLNGRVASTSSFELVPNEEACEQRQQQTASGQRGGGSGSKKSRTLRSLFISFAGQHWASVFHHSASKKSTSDAQVNIKSGNNHCSNCCDTPTSARPQAASNLFVAFAQRYFNLGAASQATASTCDNNARACHSCPVTPIKQLDCGAGGALDKLANGLQMAASAQAGDQLGETPSGASGLISSRPSVRFQEESANGLAEPKALPVQGRRFLGKQMRSSPSGGKVKFAECGVQTSHSSSVDQVATSHSHDISTKLSNDATGNAHDFLSGPFVEDDGERAKLVEQLFRPLAMMSGGENKEKMPLQTQTNGGNNQSSPMNSGQFRDAGYKLIDYICNYLDTIRERRVTPINIEPGYLKALIQPAAPEQGEPFSRIMRDFEEHIMCGLTHWQHPHFHAYFPAGNAYPSILADMLSDALGCVGFSWAASPAYTELEIIMLDWMGKMIGLPDEFLCLASSGGGGGGGGGADEDSSTTGSTGTGSSRGGGVIQGSASECVLVNLLAARHWAMEKLRKKYPQVPDGMLLSKLIGYCSKEAHSCVEKAAMIGFIRMRALDTDEHHSLRGATLAKAIEVDLAAGLEPFIVCATLGTTSCVSFDNLRELGEVCRQQDDLWLHVDAAYAGSALICPEFKYLMDGIELATSFNMNPNKWLLINFDCSLMWVKDRFKLTRAFVVDPLYLQHSFSDQAIDYRHWGIPLSRRFRALKLWFVIRNYGIEGLREYIRNHVRLAKLFASLIEQDKRFTITNQVTLGLVCFRLIGSNALNQRLLSMINASGKLHMVPASLNGRYIIRFCVCDQNAQERDIKYAYECISETASELFELIKAGKERIRAISQQNTIDVSSISLHTQQSASADRLNNGGELEEGPKADATINSSDEQQVATDTSGQAAARHVLRRSSRQDEELLNQRQLIERAISAQLPGLEEAGNQALGTRSPLVKQVSVQHQVANTTNNSSPIACNGRTANHDDLELNPEELDDEAIDAAFLDDYEFFEDDEELLEAATNLSGDEEGEKLPASGGQVAAAKQQSANLMNDSISPIQRGRLSRSSGKSSRSYSRAATTTNARSSGGGATTSGNEEEDEAADELVKLIDKRSRMSLRYKREFFVRVVSDPRVYRASISGDINAHASTTSLGSSGSTAAAPQKIEPNNCNQSSPATGQVDAQLVAGSNSSNLNRQANNNLNINSNTSTLNNCDLKKSCELKKTGAQIAAAAAAPSVRN